VTDPPLEWPDDVDAILVGDLTAGLAYATPAGGVVLTAVAPIGLRDRGAGTIGFTTSHGFGRKLERIAADPRVTLAYHTRQHGRSTRPGLVVVQGTAAVEAESEELRERVTDQAVAYVGPIKRGQFWDRWLSTYYADRVVVTVTAERILWWQDTRGVGDPSVIGTPLGPPPPPQMPPAKGTDSRVDVEREVKRLAPVHRLLAWRGEDGYPVIVAIDRITAASGTLSLEVPASLVPPGGRRAAVLAHDYRPQLIGLRSHYALGWLTDTTDGLRLAPHRVGGFMAPPNKTLLLLANGYLARRNLTRARQGGRG
jgi:hypothetical protein